MPAVVRLVLLSGLCLGVAVLGVLGYWSTAERYDGSGWDPPLAHWFRHPDWYERNAVRRMEAGEEGAAGRALDLRLQALRGEPASPYRWAAVAETYLETGEAERARRCMQRARELGPQIPPIWMRSVNLYLILEEPWKALPLARQILALTEEYDEALFGYFESQAVPVEKVLKEYLPVRPRPLRAYMMRLLRTGTVEDARLCWRWLKGKGVRDIQLTGEYVGFLLRQQAYEEARQVWSEHVKLQQPDYADKEVIFNGGFEHEPLPAPLDWRIAAPNGVTARREAGSAHSGNWCLRLDFGGKANVDFSHVSQQLVVSPGVYRLRYAARVEQLTTDRRLALRLVDAVQPGRLDTSTQQLEPTGGWVQFEERIEVPPQSRLLLIQLRRQPSLKFDNKIHGTVWLDDISLQPWQ